MIATRLANWVRTNYNAVAEQYRNDDETEVTSPNHERLHRRLREISLSFEEPISVLDVGCGTGRCFHCLENVDTLVGVDVSDAMLFQAQRPVRHAQVSARRIKLVCGNFYELDFPDHSFDFIYGIGVFGNGCPITGEICRKFVRWLKPGGQLFFDVFDSANGPAMKRVRRWLRRTVYATLPCALQQRWDVRTGCVPYFEASGRALQKVLRGAGFDEVIIERALTKIPSAEIGYKIECTAKRKLQVPEKHQAPKPKHQRNPKRQLSMR